MQVSDLVFEAFQQAWNNKDNTPDNNARSSYFVSQLANIFSRKFNGKPLVQEVDENGKKTPGEWLLDVVIVTEEKVCTKHKNRDSTIVDKILWAIESEFSTNLHEFCKDFSKLLHIKAERYLYICGLNQTTEKHRAEYIKAQTELAKSLVMKHKINEPFYIAFVPSPGKTAKNISNWDTLILSELKPSLHVVNLSENAEEN
ncbi:MAG: hypothetical protein OEV28_01050 [Nitrospirota bacterium]|nr:hypothetical protein [Nitrospirota bacterium]